MKIGILIISIALIILPVLAGAQDSPCRMEVFFGPTGGLAPRNFNKKTALLQPDLENEKPVAGNMSNPLVDMIRRAKKTIDIASYILNNRSDEYYELLKANQRGVKIRIFLDESIKDFVTEKPIIDPMVEDLAPGKADNRGKSSRYG